MRFITAVLVAAQAMTMALAQNLPRSTQIIVQLPTCAKLCMADAAVQFSCAPTDLECICPHTELKKEITKCVLETCTVKESLFAKNSTAVACGEEVRDKRLYLDVVAIVLGSLAGIFVTIRISSKIFLSGGNIGWDDWFILATILIGVADTVLIVEGLTSNGLGRDIWTLTGEEITQFGLNMYVIQVMYAARVSMLKMSLLFFYLRIFPNPIIRRLLWGTVAFNTLYGVVFCSVAAGLCQPVSFFWERWDGEHLGGKCLDANIIGWANAVVSIAVDVWMLALPLSQLRDLKLHWKKKVGVAIMFIVGTFVTVMSILRLQSLMSFATSDNPTWDNWDVVKWSTVEINVGVICACLPPLRVLLIRAFPQLSGSAKGYHSQMNQTYGAGRNGGTGRREASRGAIALNSQVASSRAKSRAMGVESTIERGSMMVDESDEVAAKGGIQCQVTYSISYDKRAADEESLVGRRHRDEFDDMPARRGSPGGASTPSTMPRSASAAGDRSMSVFSSSGGEMGGNSRALSRSRSHHRNFSRPRVGLGGSVSRSGSISALDSRERLDPDEVGPLSPAFPLPKL